MTKKEKRVLLQIDNVRVIESDERNVEVERLESVLNPKTQVHSDRWRFKGYSSTITSAMRLIVLRELLVDRNSTRNLENHLRLVEESNSKVLAKLDEHNIK